MYVTNRDIPYSTYGKTVTIPKGTTAVPATNLPEEDGRQFWAQAWEGMDENARGWMDGYGFLLDEDEVEEVEGGGRYTRENINSIVDAYHSILVEEATCDECGKLKKTNCSCEESEDGRTVDSQGRVPPPKSGYSAKTNSTYVSMRDEERIQKYAKYLS